jgi:hypothetical protein
MSDGMENRRVAYIFYFFAGFSALRALGFLSAFGIRALDLATSRIESK